MIERGRGLVDSLQRFGRFCRQLAVMVPIAMVELDEAHAALGQAARQQAVRGEGAGLFRVLAVQFEGVRRLFRKIGQFRNRRLHPERHLVLRDAGADLRIAELVVG